ncbi:hypothetical protein FAES_3620 [Fibrella aestuarina BUZ 2]|uniref:Uncharacterized protein n=1 Tax=Fibrella aestuarina BUZ 2 TaxID=1166018 RepID=I0KBX4_9BACT|nr:HEPN domain-containing protein [Fibrella aestuarina]CCH01627.1 hypothetical protein FAES_3620 [Fibrella aestuarina BUZ 2]
MNYNKQKELINSLKDISIYGIYEETAHKRQSCRTFGFGETAINFLGDNNIKKFENIRRELLNFKYLHRDITIESFEKRLMSLLSELWVEGRFCSDHDVDELYSYFLDLKRQDYEILVPLYGVECDHDVYELGQFKVYKKSYIENEKAKNDDPRRSQFHLNSIDSDYMVGLQVKARSQEKAVETAFEYFGVFENVLKYCVGDIKQQRCPGIFSYRGSKNINSLSITSDGLGFSGRTLDISLPVNLNDKLCKNIEFGTYYLWDLITDHNKGELKQRILRAVEWTGKANYEKNNLEAIVKYVFAIEGLLQLNSKDFITSSIVSQISEWLAFIMSEELEARKDIVKYFKDIYRKRSAVAHGGSVEVTKGDLHIANYLIKITIHILLTDKDFVDMNTVEDLRKYIDDVKFK